MVLVEKVLKQVVAVCSKMSMGRGCVISLILWVIVMPMLRSYEECLKVDKIEVTRVKLKVDSKIIVDILRSEGVENVYGWRLIKKIWSLLAMD